MGTKTSKSDEVEALRARLAGMSRGDVLRLAERARVAGPTVQKFRNREIGNIGGDKYLALVAVLLANDAPVKQGT